MGTGIWRVWVRVGKILTTGYPGYSLAGPLDDEDFLHDPTVKGLCQSPVLFQLPDLIDSTTPNFAKTPKGFDVQDYELVFSDDFNVSAGTMGNLARPGYAATTESC
ncbi:hypothetical protein H0H93_015768 [Arthromyces matolae]|nr:hypothetical protein H0H93_015768 [Arthromyces matolae]